MALFFSGLSSGQKTVLTFSGFVFFIFLGFYFSLSGETQRPDFFNSSNLAIATLILLPTVFFSNAANVSIKKGEFNRAKDSLLLTTVLALIFLAFAGNELGYYNGLDPHFHFKSNRFSSFFYTSFFYSICHISLSLILTFLAYIRLEFNPNSAKHLAKFSAILVHISVLFWIISFFTGYLI